MSKVKQEVAGSEYNEVPQLIADLQCIVDDLEDAKNLITEKTATVVRSEAPKETSGGSKETVTELGAQLYNLKTRISAIDADLRSIADRIEL